LIRWAIGTLAFAAVLTGCGATTSGASAPPPSVPDSALDGLLLTTDEMNSVMGTSGMVAHAVVRQMGDDRNMLPNLNCLGVWQVNEAPIYDESHWKAVRQQLFRVPDTDAWNSLVVQSVVSYRTADGASEFFTESADRWSKCTNHNVNIRVNDAPLPAWRSGDLTKTDDRLVMPYTRGSGELTRSCQHVIGVVSNVVMDVAACGAQSESFDKGNEVVAKIESKFPR
jgi:PknH-like protein